MKKCPACAEEIREEALKCRFCGTDLRPRAPVAPGIVFTHLGRRFLLGFSLPKRREPSIYAIWDREAPGPPKASFAYSDQGWTEAFGQFTSWEPDGWENPDPPACPRCSTAMEVVSPGQQGVRMAKGFLLAGAVGGLMASSSNKYRCPRCRLAMG